MNFANITGCTVGACIPGVKEITGVLKVPTGAALVSMMSAAKTTDQYGFANAAGDQTPNSTGVVPGAKNAQNIG